MLCQLQVVNAPHKAELSHELIAAAASYEESARPFVRSHAFTDRPVTNRQRRRTRNMSHRMASRMTMRPPRSCCKLQPFRALVEYAAYQVRHQFSAGFSGLFIDRLVESKGVCATRYVSPPPSDLTLDLSLTTSILRRQSTMVSPSVTVVTSSKLTGCMIAKRQAEEALAGSGDY